VPTLEGEVELSVPPNSSSGRKFRLKGKGLGAGAERGDLLVSIRIVLPPECSERERRLWKDLAAASGFRPGEKGGES
jgi:curved DNA-binding protein